jgi:hypothetical protein
MRLVAISPSPWSSSQVELLGVAPASLETVWDAGANREWWLFGERNQSGGVEA